MVLCDLVTGGAEMAALELARALGKRGHACSIAAMKGRGGELAEAFARAGAKVFEDLSRFRLDPLASCRIARLIRRERIDAMILVDVPRMSMFHGLVGSMLSGRRVSRICWCHSVPAGQTGPFTTRLKAFWKLGLLDAIVCVSRLQRRMLADAGLPRRRMPLVRNGVELRRFELPGPTDLPLPADKHIIVQVANVMPDKDFNTLLAAAKKLASSRRDFHLVLVGRDTDSPLIAKALPPMGLADVVTPAGLRKDVPSILAAADLFVLSTRSEVFSIATLEAMAAGLPVVVSDVPAFDEMFTDGREGLKVPPGDAAALAAAIARLLDDPALRERMSSAARNRAKRFSTERMAEGFERVLNCLTARRG